MTMNLLISIPAALLGSLVGSAARGGMLMAQAQLSAQATEADDQDESVDAVPAPAAATINISVSPVAALIGGAVGSMLGLRVAFWVGAVLGAAGTDRLDAMLLGRVGIDMDALVAKATEAATRARSTASDVSA
jgi:predicted MFS family arabinose efflux permease